MSVILTEQGDSVDRKRLETDPRKALPQHRQHRLAPDGVKPARQRHVEAKIFHHVRVSPALQMFALSRRQGSRISPRAVFRGERLAELIEVAYAIGGKPQKFGRWRRRPHRDKAPDGI